MIVLAGGQGTRMGRSGQLSAKSALLAYDQPILGRLLAQMCEAGFRHVLVSTGPAHFAQLSDLVSRHAAAFPAEDRSSVQVINNPGHAGGALEALAGLGALVHTPRCLLCLSDMFFRGNPFLPFAGVVPGADTCLGVAGAVEPAELSQGGIVQCRGEEILTLIERPYPARGDELRWSGLALFNRELLDVLPDFFAAAPGGSPIGHLFEFWRRRGHPLRAVPGPDFVNVNSPNRLLLATLYAAIESWQGQAGPAEALNVAAVRLRQALAESSLV